MKKPQQSGVLDTRVAFLSLILIGAFLVLFFKLPAQIAAMERNRQDQGEFYEFSQLFSEIYASVRERYVDEVDSEELFEGAIRGMFSVLDPHSQWLPPESLWSLERDTEGEFSGVGLQITLDNSVLTVMAPIPGSPAARAGMLSMDRIIEIDDESTEGITLLEAVKKLTGPSGSEVSIKVFRNGLTDLLEITLVRDTIKIESVFHKIIDGDLGYLRIVRFAEETANNVRKALVEFEKAGVAGIVVDLRNNTGGLLDKVVEICDYVLPEGQVIVSTKGRKPENNKVYESKHPSITDKPMIVLVNHGSVWASEIFAGAMQDTKRGFIIAPEGEKTYGKGSVQTISYLRNKIGEAEEGRPNQGGMRLTTAKYYTPSGRSIHKKGIKADFEVPVTTEEKIHLGRYGLLGDPDVSKLYANGSRTNTQTNGGDEDENAESQADSDDKGQEAQSSDIDDSQTVESDDSGEDSSNVDQFTDTQLEESIKYLRMTLVIQKRLDKT